MKKIFTIISVAIILIILSVNVYAENSNISKVISTISKNEIENNTLEVRLSIELENMPEGINAYTGTMKYNTEKLKLVEIEGTNGWNSPTYKDKGGEVKIAATNNTFSKVNGEIFIAKFERLKENIEYEVYFTGLEVATKNNGKTVKVVEENSKLEQKEQLEQTESKESLQTLMNEVSPEKNIIVQPIIITTIVAIIIIALIIAYGFYQRGKGDQKDEKNK